MQTNTQPQRQPFNYHPTMPEPFYSIAPGVDAGDVREYLDTRLSQLCALLMTTYGEGGESLRAYNDENQDNFMWASALLADECRSLFGRLSPMLRGSVSKPDDYALANALERLNALHRNGVLIINPEAGRLERDDASGFLDWAGQQSKGGVQ